MNRICVIAVALCMGSPSFAGESSGVDPALIDQCLAAADTDGARFDCAGTGQPDCLALAQENHADLDPVDRQLNCLDAEWQIWEAKLTETYDRLKATEQERGAERAEALVAMERDWIAFRDARCAYDRITNGRGTGGAVAEPTCRLDETARQVILLMAYQRDRT